MIKKNNLYKIIKGQHISEKTVKFAGEKKIITFKVLKSANKNQIKLAVEKIFKTKVSYVNIINVKGKKKKFKNIDGVKKNFKKALIKIKDGYEINFNELE